MSSCEEKQEKSINHTLNKCVTVIFLFVKSCRFFLSSYVYILAIKIFPPVNLFSFFLACEFFLQKKNTKKTFSGFVFGVKTYLSIVGMYTYGKLSEL